MTAPWRWRRKPASTSHMRTSFLPSEIYRRHTPLDAPQLRDSFLEPQMVHKPGPRNFSLDGNSAMLRYLPYSGGPSDSSWSTPSTSAKGSRFMHMTKMVNASMELSWTGTAITLVGERMNGSYSVTFDGNVSQHTLTSNALLSGSTADIITLFSAKDLQDTSHNLTLSVREGEIAVHSANVTINIKEEFKVTKIPVATNAIPPAANQFFLSHGFNWSVADFRGTPSLGIDVEDAQLSFYLNSTRAFEIYGRTGPAQGSFKVEVLQNSTASCSDSFTGNASSPDTDSIALLYVATNMDPTMNYRVNINNHEGKFDLDHLVIYETVPGSTPTTKASNSGSKHDMLLGVILGCVIGVLVSFLLLLVYCLRRKAIIRQEQYTAFSPYIKRYSMLPPTPTPIRNSGNLSRFASILSPITAFLGSALSTMSLANPSFNQVPTQEQDAGPVTPPPMYDPSWTQGSRSADPPNPSTVEAEA